MQCGAKYFLVTLKINGEMKTKHVTARTQIAARKTIRSHYGDSAEIISVKENMRSEWIESSTFR